MYTRYIENGEISEFIFRMPEYVRLAKFIINMVEFSNKNAGF
jgi:hypothetical protein